jgi:hypothetical protein
LARWGSTACDAIAINSVTAVIAATLGLAVSAVAFVASSWQVRAASVLTSSAAASAVFLAIQPKCLSGSFAVMDPMVRGIWFNHVSEMRSLWAVATTSPPMGAAVAAFPVVAVLGTLALACDRSMRRDFGFVVAAVALLIACVVMIVMVRAYSYAIWLAIPLVAVGALHLFAALRLSTLTGRGFMTLVLTPTVTSAVALAAVQAVTRQRFEAEESRVAAGCLHIENHARLAGLPPRLVATDVDYGPFVLALTPRSVMSASLGCSAHRSLSDICTAACCRPGTGRASPADLFGDMRPAYPCGDWGCLTGCELMGTVGGW